VATVPPLDPGGGDPARRFAHRCGADGDALPLAFGSEAGFFRQAGIPAVVCGPGSIAQAHQPDEWIALEQLARADEFMRAIGRWAANVSDSEQG
jgi:acetylornithine deacetylase